MGDIVILFLIKIIGMIFLHFHIVTNILIFIYDTKNIENIM